jgi:hypothetical protein
MSINYEAAEKITKAKERNPMRCERKGTSE